jgi:hypothetical protein
MFTSTTLIALLFAAAPALANFQNYGGNYGNNPGSPVNHAPAPKPSHTTCTYSCPDQDNGHYNSHKPSCGNEGSGLVCSFPSKNPGPGGWNRDFTCTYDPSTGKLKEDRNSGYCPKTAEQKCQTSYKRSDAEPLHVARAAVPEKVKARHVIKKRSLSRLD